MVIKGFQYIYCDESCHLLNDNSKYMILGAVQCPSDKSREISKRLRDFKLKHKINLTAEIKWSKTSPKNYLFIMDIVDYFFDDDDLGFRCVIAKKDSLDHEKFNQTHDDWYFKMYYQLLSRMIDPENSYRIYLDIKDTNSQTKLKKLEEVLINSNEEFRKQDVINNLQFVRSNDTPGLQIADILIGAISSNSRQSITSEGKKKIIERIKERTKLSLERNTLLMEKKFNLFFWKGDN